MLMMFFVMFKISKAVSKFLEFLNTRHKNIKFTSENEQDQEVLFLDVLIAKTNNSKISTHYKK